MLCSHERHESGLPGMFAGAAVARSTLRRQILYWSDRQWSLLPSNLPCTDCERKECSLFSERGGGGGSGVPALPAVPSREFAGNSGMDGNFEYGLAGAASDW